MKIRDAVYKTCGECGICRETIEEELFGCDWCARPIEIGGKRDYLRATAFYDKDRPDGRDTMTLQYCSWPCFWEGVRRAKTDYFLNLPHVHFDEVVKGQTMKDLIGCIDWDAVKRKAGKKHGRKPKV